MALVLAMVSYVEADLPPAPTSHLTPPLASVTTAPRQDSATASAEVPSLKSRSIDNCSPCDLVPWVPMARSLALDTQHYAFSVPAVPLTLPVSYGIPVTQLHFSDHQPPPDPQYGPPTAGDTRVNNAEQTQEVEKPGLPPPPLPQFAYRPPQSLGHTQHVSESNNNPATQKFVPPPPPAFLNYQLLPSVKFGPPFHSKSPGLTNIPKPSVTYLPQNSHKPPVNYLPQNTPKPSGSYPSQNPFTSYLPQNSPSPNVGRLVSKGSPQQQQESSLKSHYFLQNPIPFPTMSKTQLPPLFNYQTFHDGKRNQLYPFLQPPKPQNVVVTITETDDNCSKCQDQKQSTDSEPAQAEHVTEHLVTTTEKHENPKGPSLESQKHNFQVVKSVPLAEYLASVEYPMQIVQAPILDVPDLTKYFNLGYHNFPQAPQQGNNAYKLHDQNPDQTFALPNKQNTENYGHNFSFSDGSFPQQPSFTNLDDVSLPDEQTTTNKLPHNHKQNVQILGKNEDTTEKGLTSPSFSHTTDVSIQETTRPSQIYHINKVTASLHADSTIHTTESPLSQTISTTGGHFVTQPLTELQPPKSGEPAPFQEPLNSPSQAQPLTAPGGEGFPTRPINFKFNVSPPPTSSGSLGDWALHPYGRGWGNPLPQPFEMPTNSPHRARFENRPSPAPNKKAKHIHQIIVPYTTNNHKPAVAQEPANTIGWTPIPPINQGRKVPTIINIGDQFPSSTGFDQSIRYHDISPTENSPVSTNTALSASGSDSVTSQQILPPGSQNYLPPHIINQILHNPAAAIWPTGSEGLQQLLTTNLQSLLRGEEDSIDITSLQKNIDNWTAEGYKQNSPSVNYIPATTISHILNSKKIPNEYLTSTEPTAPASQPEKEQRSIFYQHSGVLDDNEGAASLRHQVKIQPDPHAKDEEPLKETEVTTEAVKTTEGTSKVWENVHVSISPLTKEKVYVVTPVPTTDTETSLSTSRV